MKYCVRCGREVVDEEYIAMHGMCIDCYLKYHGLFIDKPVLHITICPRCGMWKFGGEWREPVSIDEAIRRTLLHEQKKFVEPIVSILDLEVLEPPIKVFRNRYRLKVKLLVVFNNSVERIVVDWIEYVLEKKPCPKCIAFAGKSHKAYVQIRSENRRLTSSEKGLIQNILREPTIASDIIEVVENRYGLDIKFYSVNIAKRAVALIVRATGAKVVESFKPTKYDPRRGSWKGIVTISIRLPSIKAGDLVEYGSKPAIVRSVDQRGVEIEFLDSGETISIDYESYWKGVLKKPVDLYYYKHYRVIARDSSTIYLLDEETGDIREYPRNQYSGRFNEGDIVYIVKHGNREYVVKK